MLEQAVIAGAFGGFYGCVAFGVMTGLRMQTPVARPATLLRAAIAALFWPLLLLVKLGLWLVQ